jgi:glycosyltransferase involved in cell wall biosynthesis
MIISLQNQSYSNIEIICVDNNSKDNSLDILQKFAQLDNRIKVFSNPIVGVSATRNVGIQKATGEYIVFADSDDWVGVGYIKNLYEAIENNKVDMSCSVINQQDKKGNIWCNDWYRYVYLNISYNELYNRDFFLLNIDKLPLESVSKIFKTAVLKKYNILYKNHLVIGEDVDFILQYVKALDNFTFNIITLSFCQVLLYFPIVSIKCGGLLPVTVKAIVI